MHSKEMYENANHCRVDKDKTKHIDPPSFARWD